MKIIQKRERVTVKSYALTWEGEGGRGFSFDCDENGVIDESAMHQAGLENLSLCREGKMDGYTGPTTTTYTHRYTEHAVGLCSCGEMVTLVGLVNACECSVEYNNSGQRLAPRSQWGDDTGESISDILSTNHFEDY